MIEDLFLQLSGLWKLPEYSKLLRVKAAFRQKIDENSVEIPVKNNVITSRTRSYKLVITSCATQRLNYL